ncbi:MAG: hypothetical protein NC127_05540 [Muribaculum sp.]|nr:hypothetical protein [Muribaculum sp.]
MNRFLLLTLLAITSLCAKAINLSKIHVGVDYKYTLGITERIYGTTFTRNDFDMHGNTVSICAMYDINKMFTIGIGISACIYEPEPNTVPVYATFRYRPFDSAHLKNLYSFTSLGYGIPADDDDTLSSGIMADIGFGWQKFFRQHFGVNFQIGYSFHQFHRNDSYIWVDDSEKWQYHKSSGGYNSLLIGFGLVF